MECRKRQRTYCRHSGRCVQKWNFLIEKFCKMKRSRLRKSPLMEVLKQGDADLAVPGAEHPHGALLQVALEQTGIRPAMRRTLHGVFHGASGNPALNGSRKPCASSRQWARIRFEVFE